jgi:CBS domain-containing protein
MIPVCDGTRLIGAITDRDNVVRGVAPDVDMRGTPLREVMSAELLWCFDDQPADEAVRTTEQAQIRRLPVVDRERRLEGIASPESYGDRAPF